ncbi:thioredoxin [Candidatus Parcubacteria bacterium]|nr:MAG: thioredoxin [Candidatus Parcubacteria bacterium]
MEITLNDKNFKKEVLESNVPVLVDFWASWCGPCKLQGPIIDDLAKEYSGDNVKIGKLNVEENSQTASQFQIMSIPTLIIFSNGKPADVMVGVQEIELLKNKLDKLLK